MAAALALAVAAPAMGTDARDPASVVEQNCLSCHQSGAGNAPRPRHSGDWQPLLEAYGYEQVVEHAWAGRGRMPARGFCGSCTREEIEQAVRYMIPDHLLDDFTGENAQ